MSPSPSGPITAALIVGHTGNIDRFASQHHDASYNATAPIEASSGDKVRHRSLAATDN